MQCNIHPSIPYLLYIVYLYSDLWCWPRPMSKLSHLGTTRITERQAGKVESAQKADKVFIPHAAKNTLQCMKRTLSQQIPSECFKIYDIRIHISYFRGCSHPPHSSALAARQTNQTRTSSEARRGICYRTYASRYTHTHALIIHIHTDMHEHVHILCMFFVYTDLFAHSVRFESG